MNRVFYSGSGGGDGRKTVIAFGVCTMLKSIVMQHAQLRFEVAHEFPES